MLSRKIPKLRLWFRLGLRSKGGSNTKQHSISRKLLSKYLLPGIPVLSIFALVGILSVCIDPDLRPPFEHLFAIPTCSAADPDQCYDSDHQCPEGYILTKWNNDESCWICEEDTSSKPTEPDTSASLTVDDGKIKDTIFATNGEFAYASHKITVEANNIKSYTLTLSKTAGLTGPSTVNDANNTTPENMDNQWGYAWIGENDNPTTASYKALTTSNNLADINIDSNHNLNASKQLVFGAKFGNAAASGTYHAEATLSLVATPRVVTNYVVNVNCNSGTNCTSTLNTTSDEESYVYTISSTTPTRSGYKFLGYNTTNTTTANANYAPGKTVTLTAASPTLTLYAIWQQELTLNNINQMQQMTTDICKATSTGTSKTLTDSRDGNTYSIRKHEDGNCWMTQNLRLISKNLSYSDSNLNSSFSVPSSSLSGFTSSFIYASSAYYSDTNYGTYYNQYTATAGGSSSESICPKGWQLPSKENYNALAAAIGVSSNASGSSKFQNGTYKFVLSGQVVNGNQEGTGSYGYYWTRTSSQSFLISSSVADVVAHNGRYYGYPIRCVAYSN